MNYGMRFMTLYRRKGSRPSPWKRNAKKQTGSPLWGGLTNAVKEENQKGKEKRKNIYSFEYRVPKKTRRDKKAFLSDQYKEIEESSKMGKTRDLFRKLEMLREHFMQRWAQ